MENRLTREAALARIAEIERELNQLETSDQQDLERLEAREMARLRAEARGGGISAGPIGPEAEKKIGKAALRYGVPVVAGIATGGASIPAQIAAGATAAGLGEAGAQTVESVAEGQEYRPREILGATVRGAAPVFKGAYGLPKTIGAAGLAGGLGGLAEGKGPLKEAGIQAGAVGALGTIGKVAGGLGDFFQSGASRAADIERIGPGVRATVGQAFPEFAGLESRVASQTGSQELTQQLI